MEESSQETALRLARAFADPDRIRIAAALIESEQRLDQLATALNLKPRDAQRQINHLRENGLILERSLAGDTLYRFDLNELRHISRTAFATARAASPEIDGEAWEQKTLHDFVREGRLIEIPASRKKRIVILKWLSSYFEPGDQYPERDVNEMLRRYHPDFATLRRELVDNGFLAREHGIYWRVG
ncbi:MAG TPA: DUF2087 domain-containing protein [Nitrolancea sp.]|nr:DUF2087 domain-containing protein [Nitrolancea sp.]